MVTIAIRFDGGSYHATPWGTNVNEGVVEWPPSPWRLYRAFLAVGFNKLGWQEGALPEAVCGLIKRLATVLPAYALPLATAAHSRHYMPTEKGDSTAKILDTFYHVGVGAELFVEWAIELSSDERECLRSVLDAISYLGRAESWASARLVDGDEKTPPLNAVPCTSGDDAPIDAEQVQVMCPVSDDDYVGWRKGAYEQALAEASAEKGPTKAALKKLDAAFPETLLDCLLARTSTFRIAGWSAPPGAERKLYWLGRDLVKAARPQENWLAQSSPSHEFALLALSSDTSRCEVLPQIIHAMPQAENLHEAWVSLAAKALGTNKNIPEISGKDDEGKPLVGHQHAHLLPVDLDRDGRIDHFIIHAPRRLGNAAQQGLRILRRTWSKGAKHDLFLTLTGLGDRNALQRALASAGFGVSPLAQARTWISETPFVAPRYVKAKGRNSIEGQIEAELVERGLPVPVSIEARTGVDAARHGFMDFVRARRKAGRKPPSTRPWLVRLSFAEDVDGPICLGYGSHFGLGCFVPDANE